MSTLACAVFLGHLAALEAYSANHENDAPLPASNGNDDAPLSDADKRDVLRSLNQNKSGLSLGAVSFSGDNEGFGTSTPQGDYFALYGFCRTWPTKCALT